MKYKILVTGTVTRYYEIDSVNHHAAKISAETLFKEEVRDTDVTLVVSSQMVNGIGIP
jgi:hypothetical protein